MAAQPPDRSSRSATGVAEPADHPLFLVQRGRLFIGEIPDESADSAILDPELGTSNRPTPTVRPLGTVGVSAVVAVLIAMTAVVFWIMLMLGR